VVPSSSSATYRRPRLSFVVAAGKLELPQEAAQLAGGRVGGQPTSAQIAQLPERPVLIIRRATPVAVGTVRMASRRRDDREARRRLVVWASA
jgi:hypothetical protein